MRKDPKVGGGVGGTCEVAKNQTQHSPSDFGSSNVTSFGSSDVASFCSSDVASIGSSDVASFGSSNVASIGSSDVASIGSSDVASFGSSDVASFGSSDVASFGSSDVASFGLSDVASFGLRSINVNPIAVSVLIFSLERGIIVWGRKAHMGGFTTWRLFHHKMPTDENLQKKKDVTWPQYAIETSSHLFLNCSFVVKLWDWLGRIFNICFNTDFIESLLLVCNRQWCPQVKGVLVASIINTINTVWFYRNSKRFEDKKLTLLQAQSRIMLATSLVGNNSNLLTNNSVSNFRTKKGGRIFALNVILLLVVDIFNGKGVFPWRLISLMRFKVTHIFREGNTCADRLADFGVSSKCILGGMLSLDSFLKNLTKIN
ncbi:hypothetical protein Lal_00018461 [Lupinus albus]|nr:hypothetical protein Lal_00018461 [Lupinus albus]